MSVSFEDLLRTAGVLGLGLGFIGFLVAGFPLGSAYPYTRIYVYVVHTHLLLLYVFLCVYVYVCVYIYIIWRYMYIYIYIYIYMYERGAPRVYLTPIFPYTNNKNINN